MANCTAQCGHTPASTGTTLNQHKSRQNAKFPRSYPGRRDSSTLGDRFAEKQEKTSEVHCVDGSSRKNSEHPGGKTGTLLRFGESHDSDRAVFRRLIQVGQQFYLIFVAGKDVSL